MDESYFVDEARKSLYQYLDRCLLDSIDQEIFLARDASVDVVDVGYDRSTYGTPKADHERIMFTDVISLQEILDLPTGETHKTYDSGRGMAATTYGDNIYIEAQDWCDTWLVDYVSDTLQDCDELGKEFGAAGLTTPIDWYRDMSGTLAELRSRCAD